MSSHAGGKNKTVLHAVNAAGDGLVTVDSDKVPTVTAATTSSHFIVSATQNFSTSITPTNGNKSRELSLDQDKFGSGLLKAADVFQVSSDSTTTEYYENSDVAPSVESAGSTTYKAVSITYICLDPDDATKMLVLICHGGFKEGSGAFTLKKGERIKPKFDFVTKPTTAALTIKKELFDTALVVVAADVVLASGKEFALLSMAIPS